MLNNRKSNPKTIQAPNIESLMLGLIAVLIVQSFRAGVHQYPWWVRVDAIAQLLIPIGTQLFSNSLIKRGRISLGDTTGRYILQIGAIAYSLLPIFSQLFSRHVLGFGDANEFIALLMLQNAGWYLILLPAARNFRRAGFMLSSVIVLFVCFSINGGKDSDWWITCLALLYSLIAMWWLMGNYWSHIETKMLEGESRSLPIRWSFLLATGLVVSSVGLIASWNEPAFQTFSISGFMPTSGGSKWSGDYANSGLGDGDMLAGGENATTTGAVDSNQFIEDNRRSIYDSINELYEDPVAKSEKKKNRAQSIDDETTHIHNVKRSEQSGRSFRVMREPGKKRVRREYEDIVSDALFFVEGSVPARFQVNNFNHFDGTDWTNREVEGNERLANGIKVEEGQPESWFVIENQKRDFLPTSRNHRIKIMRFESEALPCAPFLERWKISKVTRKDMFSLGENGVVLFNGQLPPQTVIDTVCRVPNYHDLRAIDSFFDRFTSESDSVLGWLNRNRGMVHHAQTGEGSRFKTERDSGSQFVQVSGQQTKDRLRALADQWTAGIKPGWQQVEAIVERFRSEFSVDWSAVAPPECDNAVDHFLDERSGPSYLFATTAAQMLRAAGYQTRLATGFLVRKEDYAYRAGQSIVTTDNTHVWPEVRLDKCHWIPIEPTPGFPIPFNTESLYQLAMRKISEMLGVIVSHPMASMLITLLVVCSIRFRARLFSKFWWLYWYVVFKVSSRSRLKVTRQLIDARFRAAGYPRPLSQNIASWFGQVDAASGREFIAYWQKANFSQTQPDFRDRSVIDACLKLVNQMSFDKISKSLRPIHMQASQV